MMSMKFTGKFLCLGAVKLTGKLVGLPQNSLEPAAGVAGVRRCCRTHQKAVWNTSETPGSHHGVGVKVGDREKLKKMPLWDAG